MSLSGKLFNMSKVAFASPSPSEKHYSIQPLTLPDLPFMIQCVQSSKLELTINRLLFRDWPNPSAQTENYGKIAVTWHDPAVTRFKMVEDESGVAVGHLVLTTKPAAAPEEGQTAEIRDVPGYFNPELLAAVMDSVGQIERAFQEVECLELTHIFVSPAHRRKGLGSRMVRLAKELAQKAKLPLFAASEPQTHEFFLSNDFEDTGHADIDLTRWAPAYCGFGVFRLWGLVWVSKPAVDGLSHVFPGGDCWQKGVAATTNCEYQLS